MTSWRHAEQRARIRRHPRGCRRWYIWTASSRTTPCRRPAHRPRPPRDSALSIPPRQAEDHAGKAVAADIVAQADHHRAVDVLGIRTSAATLARGRSASRWRPLTQSVSDSASSQSGIWTAIVAIVVDDEARPVEHQLVLPADAVEIDQRQPGLDHPRRGPARWRRSSLSSSYGLPLGTSSISAPASARCGADRLEPDVLADRHAELDPAQLDRLGQRPGGEHALLVEGAVIGQFVLERPRRRSRRPRPGSSHCRPRPSSAWIVPNSIAGPPSAVASTSRSAASIVRRTNSGLSTRSSGG